MPPKGSKRKAKEPVAEEEAEDDSLSNVSGSESASTQDKKTKKPAGKKAKVAKEPVKPLDPSIPTNTTFPIEVKFEPKKEGTIRLSTWNVCGLGSCIKKGFDFYVRAEDADVLVLTETKVAKEVDHELLKKLYELLEELYEHRFWGADPKKGQSGTAVFSKIKPVKASYGLPTMQDVASTEGRCITLEFDKYYLVATYTPNAGEKLKNLEYKQTWNTCFESYLRQLDSVKPVIWTGDFNVAPTPLDLRNSKTNYNKTPGHSQAEIDGYNAQLYPDESSGHGKLVDVWRKGREEMEGQYTYYSYRFKCREKGIGWRLDSFILSERIADLAKTCEIRHECYGASDHVPVVMELEGTL